MEKRSLENLLERHPVEINTIAINSALEGKCVLVTGAAGSIGSEIIRQISRFRPGLLLLCDTAESPLHDLNLELQESFPGLKFVPLIGDIRNQVRMERIFDIYHPQYVYHAAAYKHVPLMEMYPSESVLTNVQGTKILADLSVSHEVEVFVMISTDKAVNPANIMGACKRIAEIYVQSLYAFLQLSGSEKKPPRFIITRFGNVLGSSGSVVPHFEEQIGKGGPVTVTHPDIVRYFMTVQEACQLVLEAGNMGKGGEIFVFDMGEPVRIVDLAEKMIRMEGLEPYKDIDIVFTGLRPGEKLYEELHTGGEHFISTANRRILVCTVEDDSSVYNYDFVCRKIDSLTHAACLYQEDTVVEQMKKLVPEFVNGNESVR